MKRKTRFSDGLEALEARDVPSATNLKALPVSQSEVNLTWDLTGSADTTVVVERATSATGPFQVLAQLTAPANTYTDTNDWGNTTYFYRVDTIAAGASTPFTSIVNATTQAVPSGAIARPTLTATVTSPTTATISYTAATGSDYGYLLERSSNGITYNVVFSTESAPGTFLDTGLTPGVTYSYRMRVTAFNAPTSDYSTPVSITTPTPAVGLPVAPSGLDATANSATSVTVNWTNNDPTNPKFQVYRAAYNANGAMTFTLIGTTATGAISFTDTTVKAKQPYVYQVRAVNAAGNSGYAAPASDVMQSIFGAAVGVVTPTAGTGSPTVYNIGPGQQYATLADLNWNNLGPGDTVNIYYNGPAGYNDLIQISERGTAANWITINGVPDPTTGALPIINGANGILAAQFENHYQPIDGAGVVMIGCEPGFTAGYRPGYIKIQNLVIEGGNENNKFTDNSDATTAAYPAFTAGIYIERADHITIQNCTLTNNGLGVFGAGQSGFDRLMTNVTLDGNSLYGNGVSGSYLEHNSYLEGIDTTYEYNYYGGLTAGAQGGGLKDRGAGTVIAYNYIAGGTNEIDLPEAQNEADLALTLPGYYETEVYGNVIVSTGGENPIYYGGDQGLSTYYRKGILYLYNNTIVVESNQSVSYHMAVVNLTDAGETLDARNNVIAVFPSTPGATPTNVGLISGEYGTSSGNDAYFGTNWVSSGVGLVDNGFAAGNVGGTSNLITGKGADPGFVDEATGNFNLTSSAAVLGLGGSLAGAVTDQVDEEYVSPGVGQSRASIADLGAYEYSAGGDTLSLSLPSGATAGSSFNVTVKALTSSGTADTGYTGTVKFTSSDGQSVLPANYTFTTADAGTHTFSVTLKTAGLESVTATDTTTGSITGHASVSVTAGAATTLSVSVPTTATAGTAFNATVTMKDAFGNTATGYRGTVHFTSSDGQASLPANYAFTAADNGAHTFSVTLKTAGSESVTATDTTTGSITGNASVSVSAGAATTLSVSVPTTATAGAAFNATVTMKDAFGNTATGYRGTVHFTSSDGQAVLPANYAFTATDAGVHTFSVTLKTAGSASVTATDTATSTITGNASTTVSAGAATTAQVSTPSTATAGTAFNATVTMKDAFGNTATGYIGTVHFTSTDTQSVLPGNYAFTATDAGVHTFSATLKTAGSESVTATDTTTGSITGNASVSVSAGAATTLSVSVQTTATAGSAFNATVTMKDAFGNTATGYRGTAHFTSSDGQASLPANYAFTATDNGVHAFSVTLKTAGSESVTATDTATSTITGNASTTVSAAAASTLSVSVPSTVTGGTAFNATVTMKDAFGNTATGYRGTVHFTSSDGQASLPANYAFTATDAGVHTFSVTLTTSGSQSITATDTATSTITGNASTTVSTATHFQVSAPSTATAGSSFNVTVTALSSSNATATGYTGTVHFTSSDGQAVLPADYTFTAADDGVHTFSVTLKTAGSESVTASDTATSTITGNASTTVSAGAATTLQVSTPSAATAGTAFNAILTMKDAFGNTATGYRGTVHFTSSDGQAVLPANYAFSAADNGAHTFSVTLKTAGSATLTATDTATSTITGNASTTVSAGAATTLQVSTPSTATAGTAFNATVTMKDAFGNTATGYRGTVHFTSSDGQASLPANYAFTAADNGAHTFSVTLKTAGSESVTATDTTTGSITGNASVSVSAGAATTLSVSVQTTATAGTAFNATVTMKDVFGNTATAYRGTVHFTSSDGQAVLPANYAFTATDNGVHAFSVTLKTAGSESVTATDTATSTITGNASTTVSAAAASTLSVSVPSTVTGGTAFNATVTMKDAFGNTATGYRGTVHFTSSDGQASLPANYAFTATDAGVHTFSVTLTTSGSQSITATDTATSTITGNASTTVSTATHFQVSAPSTATAGSSFNVTVTALSSSNATATGYTGTVHFTSSDGQAVLPADYTFTAADDGVHTFSVTLKTAGSESVTASDTATSTITGNASTTVSAGAATTLQVSTPSIATAGTAFNAIVTMKDAFGNTATGYLGTVHFTSSDGQASLPANYAFAATDAGVHTFSVTLKSAGSESVTASDTAISTITGNASTSVSAGAAATLQVSTPSTATGGTAFNAIVTMKDAYGNTANGYLGTVHFTSSDGQAVLPASYSFTAIDAGVHTFSVTLKTIGTQAVTATDTQSSSLTGTRSGIVVQPDTTVLAATGNNSGEVVVTNANTGMKILDFRPFDTANSRYKGQMSIALGDVNGDGVPDLIVATRGSRAGKVKVFDGAGIEAGSITLPTQTIFTAFPISGYSQGLTVAAADVNGDGIDDILAAGRKDSANGNAADVVAYSGGSGTLGSLIGSFHPFTSSFTGGVYVAARSTGSGNAEIAVSSSNNSKVQFWQLSGGTFGQIGSSSPFSTATFIAGAGDGQIAAVDNGGTIEFVTGQVSGGVTTLKLLDAGGNTLDTNTVGSGASFFAIDAVDLNQTGNDDVMFAPVTSAGGTTIDLLNPTTDAVVGTLNSFLNLTGKETISGW